MTRMEILVSDAEANLQQILDSPSYKLAEQDTHFLARPELRPVRMQLELLKPEMALVENRVRSTIVVFGSTQIAEQKHAQERLELAKAAAAASPKDAKLTRQVARAERLAAKCRYYDAAREFARLVS